MQLSAAARTDSNALIQRCLARVPTPPPSPKTNPSSGWFFFAYSRVFTWVPADSYGLRGFKKSHKFAQFFSLRVIILSTSGHQASAKYTNLYLFNNINQRITLELIKWLIFSIGRRRELWNCVNLCCWISRLYGGKKIRQMAQNGSIITWDNFRYNSYIG